MSAGQMKPPAQVIADDLRRDILSGRLAAGNKLPSFDDLADRHNVDRNTAGRAVARLREEGLVYTQHGRGTFVLDITDRPELTSSPEVVLPQVLEKLSELHDHIGRLETRIAALETPPDGSAGTPHE